MLDQVQSDFGGEITNGASDDLSEHRNLGNVVDFGRSERIFSVVFGGNSDAFWQSIFWHHHKVVTIRIGLQAVRGYHLGLGDIVC